MKIDKMAEDLLIMSTLFSSKEHERARELVKIFWKHGLSICEAIELFDDLKRFSEGKNND